MECETCTIMSTNGDMATEADGMGCDHNQKCVNCKAAGADKPSYNHTSDSRRCPVRLSKYGTARGYERKAEQTENPWKVIVPSHKPTSKAKPRVRKTKPTQLSYGETPPESPPLPQSKNAFSLICPDNPKNHKDTWNGEMLPDETQTHSTSEC
jgi:hypothetical protein